MLILGSLEPAEQGNGCRVLFAENRDHRKYACFVSSLAPLGLHVVLVGCAFTVLDMFWNTCYARRQIVWENNSQGREMERNMDLRG